MGYKYYIKPKGKRGGDVEERTEVKGK